LAIVYATVPQVPTQIDGKRANLLVNYAASKLFMIDFEINSLQHLGGVIVQMVTTDYYLLNRKTVDYDEFKGTVDRVFEQFYAGLIANSDYKKLNIPKSAVRLSYDVYVLVFAVRCQILFPNSVWTHKIYAQHPEISREVFAQRWRVLDSFIPRYFEEVAARNP
jgi:hypothetical protein